MHDAAGFVYRRSLVAVVVVVVVVIVVVLAVVQILRHVVFVVFVVVVVFHGCRYCRRSRQPDFRRLPKYRANRARLVSSRFVCLVSYARYILPRCVHRILKSVAKHGDFWQGVF